MSVEFDFKDFEKFINKLLGAAGGDFKKELTSFMQGLGNEFLRIVQDEIIRRKTMNTRLLLNSFHQGHEDNVWEISIDGLTLEVGTNVEYAKWVNDGHWTSNDSTPGTFIMKNGQRARFVPGYWSGDEFIYDPNSGGGMTLVERWVEGSHYWEGAIKILEKMYPKMLDEMLQKWLDKYFKM